MALLAGKRSAPLLRGARRCGGQNGAPERDDVTAGQPGSFFVITENGYFARMSSIKELKESLLAINEFMKTRRRILGRG